MIKFKIIKGINGYLIAKEFLDEIFINELKTDNKSDINDEKAFHIVGIENEKVICYARLYKTEEYIFTIDKIAVNKPDRLQYIGDTMIKALEDRAVSEIASFIISDVPQYAWEFFEHEDYREYGDIFIINNVKYKKMKRDLSKIRGCRGGCK